MHRTALVGVLEIRALADFLMFSLLPCPAMVLATHSWFRVFYVQLFFYGSGIPGVRIWMLLSELDTIPGTVVMIYLIQCYITL